MTTGSRHAMYSVEETVYGTTPSNPALDTVRITGTSLGLAKDSLQSEELRNDRQIADFRLGANRVAGDINFELSYETFDDLLLGVLVGDAWTADTPVVGTDQAKAGTTRHSFSFVREFSDLATKGFYIYRGCELTQMQLNVAANSIITGSFTVVGASQEIADDLTGLGTPTFPAATTTKPLDSFTGTINEGGVLIAVVTELTLNLQNGIDPRFVVGSKDSIRPSIARSNLTGQVTAYFENSTLVEKFINETESSLDFTLPDADGNEIKFIIPRIVYTGGQPDVNDEGPVVLTMPFQALLDDTEATNILIERNPV